MKNSEVWKRKVIKSKIYFNASRYENMKMPKILKLVTENINKDELLDNLADKFRESVKESKFHIFFSKKEDLITERSRIWKQEEKKWKKKPKEKKLIKPIERKRMKQPSQFTIQHVLHAWSVYNKHWTCIQQGTMNNNNKKEKNETIAKQRQRWIKQNLL